MAVVHDMGVAGVRRVTADLLRRQSELLGSAVFTEPDTFCIDRDPNSHRAFLARRASIRLLIQLRPTGRDELTE